MQRKKKRKISLARISEIKMIKMHQFNDKSIGLIKLKAEALDTGHLKLATWGTKRQLVDTLRNNVPDPFRE